MRIWALIPAAGCGTRFGGDLPKQYLDLAGKTIIEHSIEKITMVSGVLGIVVVLAPGDKLFERLCSGSSSYAKIMYAIGGRDRASSVYNGLQSLSKLAQEDDWVLVHDAVRPCVRMSDITSLINTVGDDSVGGFLGCPVTDTLKQVGRDDRVVATVNRSALWSAFTPQLFRYGRLRSAMELGNTAMFTDESSAIEALGYQPKCVKGSSDNLKITRKRDLTLAKEILIAQRKEAESAAD